MAAGKPISKQLEEDIVRFHEKGHLTTTEIEMVLKKRGTPIVRTAISRAITRYYQRVQLASSNPQPTLWE